MIIKQIWARVNGFCLIELYKKLVKVGEHYALGLVVLGMRFWMAQIFWYSGLTKISSWHSTVYLFEYEYKTPFFPPEVSAALATTFELVCPVFLLLGLGARFAAVPMLVMTAVIQFTYLDSKENLYWAFLLATIWFYGPGMFSMDYLLRKKYWSRF